MRTWIIPLAVLLVVPALGAATPIVAPPERENLVEGHTVFTVIEQVNTTAIAHTEYAAAVAVLVREATAIIQNDRFPGVLWFNDQYLVDPIHSYNAQTNIRYPCTGAVLAVNAGDSDPRLAPWGNVSMEAGYIESYLITDPNDRVWNVDKWTYTDSNGAAELIWTVAIMDNQAGYSTPDDGICKGSIVSETTLTTRQHVGPTVGGQTPVNVYSNDSATAQPAAQPVASCRVEAPVKAGCEDVGGTATENAVQNDGCTSDDWSGRANTGLPPPAGAPYTQGPQRCYMDGYGHGAKYNAVLFFFLEDLLVAGADKDHSVPSSDVSGCQVESTPGSEYFADHWPCPGNPPNPGMSSTGCPGAPPTPGWTCGDDNAEGNSHAFNPFQYSPVCPHCTGSGNHGGSGASGNQFTHATRDVDIYFGIAQAPLVRQFRLMDTQGSLAPYHCEEGQIGDANNPDTDLVCIK